MIDSSTGLREGSMHGEDPPPPDSDRQLGAPEAPPPPDPGTPSGDPRDPTDSLPPDRGIGPAWLRGVIVLLLVPAVQVAVNLGTGAAFGTADGSAEGPGLGSVASVAAYLAGAGAGCAVLFVAWLLLDRRPVRDLGHRGPLLRAVRSYGIGALAGLGLIAIVVGIGAALGGWTVETQAALPATVPLVAMIPLFVGAGYAEELFFRGYLGQAFGRRSLVIGAVLSSAVFSALHLANPEVWDAGTALGVLAGLGVFVAGLLLFALFVAAGDIWLPAGAHFAWNWGQGVLFGFPVSGFHLPSLLRAETTSDSTVFGSGFGPESSLIAIVLLGVLGVGLMAWLVRRGEAVPVTAAIRRESPSLPDPPA